VRSGLLLLSVLAVGLIGSSFQFLPVIVGTVSSAINGEVSWYSVLAVCVSFLVYSPFFLFSPVGGLWLALGAGLWAIATVCREYGRVIPVRAAWVPGAVVSALALAFGLVIAAPWHFTLTSVLSSGLLAYGASAAIFALSLPRPGWSRPPLNLTDSSASAPAARND
jgi:hypothetical protein